MTKFLILAVFPIMTLGCTVNHFSLEGHWRLDVQRQKADAIEKGYFNTNSALWQAPQLATLDIQDGWMIWQMPAVEADGKISQMETRSEFTSITSNDHVLVVQVWDEWFNTNILVRIELEGNRMSYIADCSGLDLAQTNSPYFFTR